MTVLIIVNESPYGSERAFNALRLARGLQLGSPETRVRLFLLSDGVTCALPNQLRPEGSSNLEAMLAETLAAGAEVRACITCLDHRGLFGAPLVPGIEQGNMTDLATWTLEADRIVTF